MAITQEDENLWGNFKSALQIFLHTESFKNIQKANMWLASQLQDVTLQNICLRKKPRFQNLYFTGEMAGDIGYRPTGMTIRSFYQSFSGRHWLMVNEDESDLDCCLGENASYVKKLLGVTTEGLYSIKDEDKVALAIGTRQAAYRQCGANTYIDNERLLCCTTSKVGDAKDIPIRPIYVMTSGKKGRILIGTYFEETNKIEIKIYDINNRYNYNIRSRLDLECKLVNKTAKKDSKKSSKKIVKVIFFFLAIIAVSVCIGYLLSIF